MNSKVAIPIWNGRISPVMDTAHHLLIVEITDGRETSRTMIDIPLADISHRAKFISGLGINELICAAISSQFERLLGASGIKIKPWFQGEVDQIIAAYSGGVLHSDNFFSPGRGRRCRRGGNGPRGGGRGRLGRNEMYKEDK